MKKIWPFVALLIIGCVATTNIIKLNSYELAASEGFTAYSFAWHHKTDVKEQEGNVKGCTCNGTKKVKSGDGLATIPCPCGDKCTCKTDDKGSAPVGSNQCTCVKDGKCACDDCSCDNCPALPSKYIVFVTASDRTCVNCKKAHKILDDNGWISQGKNRKAFHYIEKSVGDISPDNDSKYWKQYKTDGVPTYILMVNNKEVKRYVGVLEGQDLVNFFNNVSAQAQNQVFTGGCANGNCGKGRRK